LTNNNSLEGRWALVLGSSSGFGAATSLELARHGMNIFGVHLDLRSTLPNAERIVNEIRDSGCEAVFFNMNAADADKRKQALEAIKERLGDGETVRVLLHSLAFGSLRPFVPENQEEALKQPQMEMTLDVMANSLVYWVQDLYYGQLLGPDSRLFAMTSIGSTRIWPGYGAVSAAKAALESHVRQLSYELAPSGVRINAILAGVTDTPALRKIPGHEALVDWSRERNPSGRMTTPEDVAKAIAMLSGEGSGWITGDVIRVDGGENISG
jgi:NAD(P)-dependent dehydrogenase (short-subunit alcohol dehydrogenase family)